jgi:hypothetical protein
MDIDELLDGEPRAWTVSDRLRWTSDFLDLASKAIAIIACAQGLDLPANLHRSVQADLRAWASYLDGHPSWVAELQTAGAIAASL